MGAIGGMIAGGLLGGLASKKSSTSTSVQKADPWGPVQPHLRSLYDQSANIGHRQYFPGSTVADFGMLTNWGHNAILNKGAMPDPLLTDANRTAQGTMRGDYLHANPSMPQLSMIGGGRMLHSNPGMSFLNPTARGDYLNANPYVDSMFDQAASRVGDTFSKYTMPGITSNFSLGGRYGSNAHQEALGTAQQNFGDTLNRLATDIYGGNYARERGMQQDAQLGMGRFFEGERGMQQQALGMLGDIFGRERSLQQQAVGMAPELMQAGYYGIDRILGVGAQQDALAQRKLSDQVARWDFNQNEERERLAFINDILNGAKAYGTTTTSGRAGSNPILGAMGGAMMGGRLGGMIPTAAASMFAPGMAAGAGWGTGAMFGNQDFGLFI